jgi:hypothetical protein
MKMGALRGAEPPRHVAGCPETLTKEGTHAAQLQGSGRVRHRGH